MNSVAIYLFFIIIIIIISIHLGNEISRSTIETEEQDERGVCVQYVCISVKDENDDKKSIRYINGVLMSLQMRMEMVIRSVACMGGSSMTCKMVDIDNVFCE